VVHGQRLEHEKLIRHLVTSHAYQLATTYDVKNHEADPDNAPSGNSPRTSKRRRFAIRCSFSGQLDLEPVGF
jgi:hypothetical protein